MAKLYFILLVISICINLSAVGYATVANDFNIEYNVIGWSPDEIKVLAVQYKHNGEVLHSKVNLVLYTLACNTCELLADYKSGGEQAIIQLYLTYEKPGGIDVIARKMFAINVRQSLAKIRAAALSKDEAAAAEKHSLLGLEYVKQEKYDLAIKEFSKAIALGKESADIYDNRAEAFIKVNQYDSALDDINHALLLNSTKASYYETRGRAFLGKRLYGKALWNLNHALELDNKLASVYFYRAQLYESTGRTRGAYLDYSNYAGSNSNTEEVKIAREKCILLSHSLPEIEWNYSKRTHLDYRFTYNSLILSQDCGVKWLVGKNGKIQLQYLFNYSLGAELKLTISSIERYGDYTKIVVMIKNTANLQSVPACYFLQATIEPLTADKYVIELWGVDYYKNLSDKKDPKLLESKEFVVS